jgi:DNA helicase-2/ATP-dependent DNA helicase PcrA
MTRAKEKLYMTCAAQRMLFGKTSANRPSRFVGEIPPELMEQSGRSPLAPSTEEDEPWGYSQSARPAYGGGVSRGPRQTEGYGTPAPRHRPARPVGIQGGYTPRPAAAGVALPDLRKGDMLTHKAFGTGMVLSIQPMGGDALIEIAFDTVGTKKLMLKSASQHMTKL